ncbi:unnamed protein product [Discosporangium mesarthrocarpum]
MNIQLKDGDWLVVGKGRSGNQELQGNEDLLATQRWQAFRSWYRCGRVFDRAPDDVVTFTLLGGPSLPGSMGRPITPRLTPAAPLQEVAPCGRDSTLERNVQDAELTQRWETRDTVEAGGGGNAAAGAGIEKEGGGGDTLSKEAGEARNRRTEPQGLVESVRIKPTRDEWLQLSTPELKSHELDPGEAWADGSRAVGELAGGGGKILHGVGTQAPPGPGKEPSTPTVGDQGQVTEKPERSKVPLGHPTLEGENAANPSQLSQDPSNVPMAAGPKDQTKGGGSGLGVAPPVKQAERLAAAKRLRMESRSQFLKTRTEEAAKAAGKVGRLIEIKRADVREKRTAGALGGVPQQQNKEKRGRDERGSDRGEKKGRQQQRRRSKVEHELAVKKMDELLESCGKAEEVRKRRGTLGSLRPEDVAQIGVFDNMDLATFEPDKPNLELLQHHSSEGSDDHEDISDDARNAAAWAPRTAEETVLEIQLACVHPGVLQMAVGGGVGVPDPEDASSPLLYRRARWKSFAEWYSPPPSQGSSWEVIPPHRQLFLDEEADAAFRDERIRESMHLDDKDLEKIGTTEFLEWYNDGMALHRQAFRRHRVESILLARRALATQILAWLPRPYLFQALPPPLPPPPLPKA